MKVKTPPQFFVLLIASSVALVAAVVLAFLSTSPEFGSPTAPTDSAAGVWSHILVVVAIAGGVGVVTLAGVERMLSTASVRLAERTDDVESAPR